MWYHWSRHSENWKKRRKKETWKPTDKTPAHGRQKILNMHNTYLLAGVSSAGLRLAELTLVIVDRNDLHHNGPLGLVLQV